MISFKVLKRISRRQAKKGNLSDKKTTKAVQDEEEDGVTSSTDFSSDDDCDNGTLAIADSCIHSQTPQKKSVTFTDSILVHPIESLSSISPASKSERWYTPLELRVIAGLNQVTIDFLGHMNKRSLVPMVDMDEDLFCTVGLEFALSERRLQQRRRRDRCSILSAVHQQRTLQESTLATICESLSNHSVTRARAIAEELRAGLDLR